MKGFKNLGDNGGNPHEINMSISLFPAQKDRVVKPEDDKSSDVREWFQMKLLRHEVNMVHRHSVIGNSRPPPPLSSSPRMTMTTTTAPEIDQETEWGNDGAVGNSMENLSS